MQESILHSMYYTLVDINIRHAALQPGTVESSPALFTAMSYSDLVSGDAEEMCWVDEAASTVSADPDDLAEMQRTADV